MFGIGLPELILIMIVALLVVGPRKLPDLARSLGKALHDFKKMTDDVKQTFEEEVGDKKAEEEVESGEGAEGVAKIYEETDSRQHSGPAPAEASKDSPDSLHSSGYGDLRG